MKGEVKMEIKVFNTRLGQIINIAGCRFRVVKIDDSNGRLTLEIVHKVPFKKVGEGLIIDNSSDPFFVDNVSGFPADWLGRKYEQTYQELKHLRAVLLAHGIKSADRHGVKWEIPREFDDNG